MTNTPPEHPTTENPPAPGASAGPPPPPPPPPTPAPSAEGTGRTRGALSARGATIIAAAAGLLVGAGTMAVIDHDDTVPQDGIRAGNDLGNRQVGPGWPGPDGATPYGGWGDDDWGDRGADRRSDGTGEGDDGGTDDEDGRFVPPGSRDGSGQFLPPGGGAPHASSGAS